MHATSLRVRFSEVDLMGVVYHPNYLSYFEIGRTDLIAQLGFPYSELEARGERLVVVDAAVRYRQPARYADELSVRTRITRATGVRITFAYEIVREEDGAAIAGGETTLAFVGRDGRPRRMPDDLRDAIDRCRETHAP